MTLPLTSHWPRHWPPIDLPLTPPLASHLSHHWPRHWPRHWPPIYLRLKIEEILQQRFNNYACDDLLYMLASFVYIQRFPINFLNKIFTPHFLSRIAGKTVLGKSIVPLSAVIDECPMNSTTYFPNSHQPTTISLYLPIPFSKFIPSPRFPLINHIFIPYLTPKFHNPALTSLSPLPSLLTPHTPHLTPHTPLHTPHTPLHTPLHTPHSTHPTPHTPLHTPHSTHPTPHTTTHSTHPAPHPTPLSTHPTPHTPLLTPHPTPRPTPHTPLHSPHTPLLTPRPTPHTPPTPHSTLHTPHSSHHTPLHTPRPTLHSTHPTPCTLFHTPHSTLHTPHSTHSTHPTPGMKDRRRKQNASRHLLELQSSIMYDLPSHNIVYIDRDSLGHSLWIG